MLATKPRPVLLLNLPTWTPTISGKTDYFAFGIHDFIKIYEFEGPVCGLRALCFESDRELIVRSVWALRNWTHIDGHCVARAVGESIGVVEEGPSDEATGVNDAIVGQSAVQAAADVSFGLTGTGIRACPCHLVVGPAPHIPVHTGEN